ncbi:rod-binding protein [Sphingobium sp. AP49]|uniref:rod-binding protein n=1 Tax=Sphingobium sp. AP49 TaxID=1144307 RepID=UPI00026EE5B0|nr:rod-binding protein [Sphingobium sp. AP49]WHO38296.1 rod-binding protein [Sphingobium sp. AP49]
MQISTVSGTSGQTASSTNKAGLEKAAQQFEAIFLRQMIGAMRSASLADGITDSSASDQFRDMADARTADSMATKGSLGIAELLLKQFSPPSSVPAPDGPTPAEGA